MNKQDYKNIAALYNEATSEDYFDNPESHPSGGVPDEEWDELADRKRRSAAAAGGFFEKCEQLVAPLEVDQLENVLKIVGILQSSEDIYTLKEVLADEINQKRGPF